MAVSVAVRNVDRLLELRGWNQGALAKAAGLDATHLSKLLVGVTPDPRASTVQRIADAFGVNVLVLSSDQLSKAELRRELSRSALARAIARGLRRDPAFDAYLESEEAPVSVEEWERLGRFLRVADRARTRRRP